jgi:hypothetical protein
LTTVDNEIATLQTSVDDLPTNAELATSQAAADDATLAAIAGLNDVSAAEVVTAIEASTDLPIAKYTNAAGDECLFVISESEPHITVDCTEAP